MISRAHGRSVECHMSRPGSACLPRELLVAAVAGLFLQTGRLCRGECVCEGIANGSGCSVQSSAKSSPSAVTSAVTSGHAGHVPS